MLAWPIRKTTWHARVRCVLPPGIDRLRRGVLATNHEQAGAGGPHFSHVCVDRDHVPAVPCAWRWSTRSEPSSGPRSSILVDAGYLWDVRAGGIFLLKALSQP